MPKKPSFDIGLSLGGDMHAHWVPGIDDGAKNLEEGLKMIQHYVEMGFSRLCATPHIYPELYPNTQETIEAAYASITPEISTRFPHLELAYAAEYFLDSTFNSMIEPSGLLCFDTDKLLIEQSFFAESPNLKDILFSLQMYGYQPVLAHPERYAYYHTFEKRIHFFQDANIKLQLNLLSLAGKYGKRIAQVSTRWLLEDYYDYVGTDAHSSRDLELLAAMHLPNKLRSKLETLKTF